MPLPFHLPAARPRRLAEKLALLAAALCVGCGVTIVDQDAGGPWIAGFVNTEQSADVHVLQGYASGTSPEGESLHYFFNTRALYRSRSYHSLDVIASNRSFLLPGVTHLGAGDYYDGHVYGVMEHWHGCNASSAPIFIAVFNGETLALESTVEISSDLPEASGIAIDPENRHAIVSSFCDARHLYVFRLSDWSFLGTIPLALPVSGNQGLTYRDGFLYCAATGGALYGLRLSDNSMKLLLQAPMHGEYEGVDFHSPDLRWLVNLRNGTHILYSYTPIRPPEPESSRGSLR